MKRRDFISKAGLAGAGVAATSALATPAIAADRVEIAMVSTWPRDFQVWELGHRDLQKN